MFREGKATAVAGFFLEKAPNRRLNDLKLMKLLYIAERESLRQFTASITGGAFFSMKNGPVVSEVVDIYKGRRPTEVWSRHIHFLPWKDGEVSENTVELVEPVNLRDFLSKAEIDLLERVWAEHGRDGKWQLVQLTHEFPEWDPDAARYKTSSPLPLAKIFEKGLGEDYETALAKADEIVYFEELLA